MPIIPKTALGVGMCTAISINSKGHLFLRTLDLDCSYGEKIAVGADIKDGKIAIKGWIEKSDIDAYDFCEKMQKMGVKTIICTDISKDGAMKGANHALYRTLSEKYDMQLVASGGVSSMEDVEKLAELDIYGAIIGKAYYTGAIALEEAINKAKR